VHQGCSCRGSFGRSRTRVKQEFVSRNFIPGFIPREITRHKHVASDKKVIVPVTVYIPGPLREFSEGQNEVEIGGSPATLADALSALWIIFPGLRDRVATETGEIRQHINIFIGEEDIRFTGGLASRIPAGAEISIVPSITGG
jgi:molybdopterin converting factor small subunit